MNDTEQEPRQRPRLVVNLGCGQLESTSLPALFATWRELRVDSEAVMVPDLLADITDLSAIETGSADAVWMAHCLEHLYLHQVNPAIAEAYRILADDGFFCVIVPDLQTIGEYIVGDRLHEEIYMSPAGPVTAHDMLFGYAPFLARGQVSMAHRSGFTPTLLVNKLQEVPFAEIVLRRRPNQELAAIAFKRRPADDAARAALLSGLQL